jgi:hypothetical protein
MVYSDVGGRKPESRKKRRTCANVSCELKSQRRCTQLTFDPVTECFDYHYPRTLFIPLSKNYSTSRRWPDPAIMGPAPLGRIWP